MIKNFLKITFRSLFKNKLFVFINVLGLGISLACCMVAYLSYDFNSGYDKQHVNASSIYRVNMIHDFPTYSRKYGIAPLPVRGIVMQNFGEVDKVTGYIPTNRNVRIGEDVFDTGVGYVDSTFLDMFTFPLKYGSKTSLKDKSKVIISDELALKYFNKYDVVGEPITIINGKELMQFEVGGVFEKMPLNSSFQFDMLSRFDNYFDFDKDTKEDDWGRWTTLLIQVDDPGRLAAITKRLENYIAPQNKARPDFEIREYYLDPFKGMAIRSEAEDVGAHWFRQSLPRAAAVAPGVMALLILLIACFNFTNTSIAISNRRLKEIGVRKTMGSLRGQLVSQFLGENLILTFMALLVALLVAEFLVPAYNEMWPFLHISLSYSENIPFYGFLALLLFSTAIIAGSYPAFYITSFNATSILRGTLKFGGSNIFTKVLLTAQFAISLSAILAAIVFIQNARFQQTLDYGFDRDGVVYGRINGQENVEALGNAMRKNPKVKQVAYSAHQLMSSAYSDPVKHEDVEREVEMYDVGDNYFSTMGVNIIAGREFKLNSESDRKESIIVNREFVDAFQLKNPIGTRVVMKDTIQLFVIGVVADIYTGALWQPIDPLMFRYAEPEKYRFAIVNSDVKDTKAVYEYMENQWKELFPNELFRASYMDDEISEAAEVNNNIATLFIFLGILATILCATGLYTLVSLNIIRRMKEIGVRKVLGATILNIAGVLNKPFVIMLLLASVFGCAMGYFLVDTLMSSIWAYHVNIGLMAILSSVVFILVLSMFTIGYKVYKASSANPVVALRDE